MIAPHDTARLLACVCQLEPGEVDRDRQRRFLNCCRREARMKRVRGRRRRRRSSAPRVGAGAGCMPL